MILNKSLKNNDGNGLILGIVIILILLMIFTVVSEYLRNNIILNGVRDGLESIATNIATENYNEIYPNIRQGYSGAYKLSNTNKWQEHIDNGNIDKELNRLLGVKKEGNIYVKRFDNDNSIEYKLFNLKVNINNPKLAPEDGNKNKEKFTVEVVADIELERINNIFEVNKVKTRLGAKVMYIPRY